VDVRVVVATNKDLQGLMKERKFREDLYYRLNVIPIYLCPLREKKEDIPLLIRYFIEKYNKILHKRIKGIEDEAVRLLSEYHWPGNVRELGNLIERVIALADEEKEIIAMTDLPSEIRKGDASILDNQELATARGDMDFKVLVNEFEKKIINETMAKVKKKKEAAKLLNLNPRILRYLIKKHGLENESPPC